MTNVERRSIGKVDIAMYAPLLFLRRYRTGTGRVVTWFSLSQAQPVIDRPFRNRQYNASVRLYESRDETF